MVILRDRLPCDVDSYARWRVSGEWKSYDAPWEASLIPISESDIEQYRQRFLTECLQSPPAPRRRATIATRADRPIGWVNRYAEERFPDSWLVGIDICEDDCLNRNLGTEAAKLWVNYLFAASAVHRLGLNTWSFNSRMIRVAEKLGFVREGTRRQLIRWQDDWLDLVLFGMLREEWEKGAGRNLT